MKLKTLLFTKNSNYERIINMNLEYKSDLIQYKDYIFNRLTLSWGTLDKIKLMELKINIKYDENINLLISKTDKFCYLVFKMIEQYNNNNIINILDDNKINQKQIIESLNKLKEKTDHNHEIISKLEKEYNYSDLKDLDIEFYYQFLIHINSLINAMSQRTKIRINEDKYLSNEYLSDKKDFQNLVKNLSNHFVTKKELKEEAKLEAIKLIKICETTTSNSVTDELAHLYFCDLDNATFSNERNPDDTEELQLKWFGIDEAIDLIHSNTIKDSLTQISIFFFKNKLFCSN